MFKLYNKNARIAGACIFEHISHFFLGFLLLTSSIYVFTELLENSLMLAKIDLFKVSSRNTKKRFQTCLKLTIKTQERRQCRRSGVFIVNFKHI